MDLLEIKRLAKENAPMPPLLTSAELCYFQACRHLYWQYRDWNISLEDAQKEMAELTRRAEIDLGIAKMYREQLFRIGKLDAIVKDMETSGCPYCKKALMLLDGRMTMKEVEALEPSNL